MGRYDATKAMIPTFRVIEPHAMKTRNESIAGFKTKFDLTKTLPYLEKFNENLEKKNRLTLFHLFLNGAARTVGKFPKVNRFITGRKFWQRNRIQFSFVVKKQLKINSTETFAKIDFSPYDTIDDVRKRVHEKINESRTDEGNEAESEIDFFGRLPRFLLMIAVKVLRFLDFFGMMPKFLIEPDPLYSSLIFANLGSVGLNGSTSHHLFEWGNSSWFITIGKIHKSPVADDITGEISAKDMVDVVFSLDERISEGIYYVGALKSFRKYVENPALLEKKPEFTEEQIFELGLKDPLNKKEYRKWLKKRKKKIRRLKREKKSKKTRKQ